MGDPGATLALHVANMKNTNEHVYGGTDATNIPNMFGSKYFSFCPPLVKLWVDIAGMSYPT